MTHYLVAMGLFGILRFAIFGLIIGALAKFFMPGKDPGGFWITMLLGMSGSLIATWILQAMGHYQEGQTAGWIASLLRRDFAAADLPDVQGQDNVGLAPRVRLATFVVICKRSALPCPLDVGSVGAPLDSGYHL